MTCQSLQWFSKGKSSPPCHRPPFGKPVQHTLSNIDGLPYVTLQLTSGFSEALPATTKIKLPKQMLAHLANINFFQYDLQIYTVKINP